MTYRQALEYIHATEKFGSKPGLKRIEGLLAAMGNPERRLRIVHVAGTNGKGSTCAMTAQVLQSAGYRTGLYVSPFVEEFRERIQIDRRHISEEELAALTLRVKTVIDELVAAGGLQPTEFEIITSMAFVYFAEQNCDFVVLEVGLGGRFDATNVIPPPLVAAVTPISIDHAKVLGYDVATVAFEKCGIIKSGCVAVTCAGQAENALRVIRETCAELGCVLRIPDETSLEFHDAGLDGARFSYRGMQLSIGLPGAHQIQNALTVCEIVGALRMKGVAVDDEALRSGLAEARWNGRLEVVRQEPLCLVDGAHNPDAMAVLCASIDSLLSGRRLITVMAMSADKDIQTCVPMVARRSDVFVAVQADTPRALGADAVRDAALAECPGAVAFESLEDGVRHAMAQAGGDDVVLACGSLYMIGHAKLLLQAYA